MRANKIKVGHIYYVNYDPVRKMEFQGKHLAFVLKKNYNKISFVTISLTSKGKSEITNIPLGKISTLPGDLGESESYAVIDQVRTVNASRFSPILENDKAIDVEMPENLSELIINSVANDLFRDFKDIEISIKKREKNQKAID